MKPTVLVTDTHPLVWYLSNQHGKLPQGVRLAFQRAVVGDAAIWIPTVVLWEISLLEKIGKLRLRVPLSEHLAHRFFAHGLHTVDLTPEDVVCFHGLTFTTDPWDAMIVAVALRLECPLITRDRMITNTKPCEIYWE